jgi:hypothetical protein
MKKRRIIETKHKYNLIKLHYTKTKVEILFNSAYKNLKLIKQTLSVFLFFSRYSQKASSFNIFKVVVYGQWSTVKNTIKYCLSVF